jgi:hypothetical protein
MIQINDSTCCGCQIFIMSFTFHAGLLSGSQIAEALPLVQATWPETDLASWQRYVQFFSGKPMQGSGVLRDSAGNLCGILVYRTHCQLGTGTVLAVNLFTAVDVINSLQTVRALLEAAEGQAAALHCSALEIRLDSSQAQLGGRLRALGLSPEAGLLGKKISPPRGNR